MAKALEGILAQLTFVVHELRKSNEHASDADRFASLPPLKRSEVRAELEKVTEEWRPLKTVGGRQIGWLFPNENLAGIQVTPLIMVDSMTEDRDGFSITGTIRTINSESRIRGHIRDVE